MKIKDLDPYVSYSIGVRAKNNKGIGHMSNIETFKLNDTAVTRFDEISQDYDIKVPGDSNYTFCN